MKRASRIGHLKPFLPGLETLLEDPEVSEIMINGPGNVWIERGGELEPIEAPALTAAALHRAATGSMRERSRPRRSAWTERRSRLEGWCTGGCQGTTAASRIFFLSRPRQGLEPQTY